MKVIPIHVFWTENLHLKIGALIARATVKGSDVAHVLKGLHIALLLNSGDISWARVALLDSGGASGWHRDLQPKNYRALVELQLQSHQKCFGAAKGLPKSKLLPAKTQVQRSQRLVIANFWVQHDEA